MKPATQSYSNDLLGEGDGGPRDATDHDSTMDRL
jgi:hypothetical protein